MPLSRGEPLPWFVVRSPANERYQIGAAAGRYIVLAFIQSAARADAQAFLAALNQQRDVYDDVNVCCFIVSNDPTDEQEKRLANSLPGIRIFWDADYRVSSQCRVLEGSNPAQHFKPQVLLLDWRLRVLENFSFEEPEKLPRVLAAYLSTLPKFGEPVAANVQAPALVVPNVFEKSFCEMLIQYYKTHGGKDSGFMREIDGKTVGIYDYSTKRRADCMITDAEIQRQIRARVNLRLVPEIKKAFQFEVTHMERYIIACYESETSGFFKAHRDNTTKGTAHRKFAVTLNLNAEEFEGGNLRFPEFGPHYYRAPTGGAVVFSCSLLHEAMPVTKGTRYVFLPFVYNEEGAKIRAENEKYITSATPPDAQANQNDSKIS